MVRRDVRVAKARKATSRELTKAARSEDAGWSLIASCALAIHHANQLDAKTRQAVVELFEVNMKALYEASSDGYNPAEKREELFHVNARFVCAHTQDTTPRLAGFAIWRFDMDGEDEVEVPVVYCYEVQVAAEVAGKGIGRRLMDVLALMAKAYNLDKVVLTVFKANEPATAFYRKLGYEPDVTDPSQAEESEGEEVDYQILSLRIRA